MPGHSHPAATNDSRPNPNRAIRRSPRFKVAVDQLQAFTLDALAVEGIPLWQLRVAAQVVERIAHGKPQTVSTQHLQERCHRAGTGGGRYYTDRPSYGTVARLLVTLRDLGILTWERCQYDPLLKRSPPRRIQLQGEALSIVAAALRATWTQAVSPPLVLRSQAVPRIQSAMGADPAPRGIHPPEHDPPLERLDFSGARALGLLSDR